MQDKDESQLIPPYGFGGYVGPHDRGSTGAVSDADFMIAKKTGEHTQQIKGIQTCIMRLEGQVRSNAEHAKKTRDHTVDIDHMVQLHGDDIREIMGLFQALAMRISRIEEQLGITEPVVVPGD